MTSSLVTGDRAFIPPDPRQIVFAGVTHRYHGSAGEVPALARTDLEIRGGQFVCLLGPSGCGKTTLLRLVAGFITPTEGSVLVGGDEVHEPSHDRGVVFQQASLYPWLTVRGNIEFGPRMQRVGRARRREISERYLDLVGLAGFADAAPYELSGGMQQRAQIARVLAAEPRILLMDEPFAALDALTRERLQGELLAITSSARRTVLFVTHSVEEALLLADRVVVMSDRPGRIIADEATPAAARAGGRSSPELTAAAEHLRSLISPEDR